MTLRVDESLCAGHALCTVIAPDVFEMNDHGKAVVVGEINDENAVDVDDAIKECPAHAILLTSDTA